MGYHIKHLDVRLLVLRPNLIRDPRIRIKSHFFKDSGLIRILYLGIHEKIREGFVKSHIKIRKYSNPDLPNQCLFIAVLLLPLPSQQPAMIQGYRDQSLPLGKCFLLFSLATQAMQGSRLRSAYCYCCTAWPAALCGLCSKAEKKKTLAQWETLVVL